MRRTMIAALLAVVFVAGMGWALQDDIPTLDHVFVIVLENHAYTDIIGNINAPFINVLATTYNTATNYMPVWHPSLPNYLALISGDFFGVTSDDAASISFPPGPYSFAAPTIGTQLEAIGKDWRSYQEGIPAPGSLLAGWPHTADVGSLYSVKHDPFMYFQAHQTPAELSKSVPLVQLFSDLAVNQSPAFSLIVPDQCNDMHGQNYPHSPCAGYDDAQIVARGDHESQMLVNAITGSDLWEQGRNALFLVFDENQDFAAPGSVIGPPALAIVVTNYGVREVQDPTSYNHYSLLKTIEAGFGLPYLGHAGDASTLTMAPMMKPR